MRLNAQEVVALSRFEEGHTLGHLGIADDDARLLACVVAGSIESLHQSVDVIAVDPWTNQPKASNFGASGSKFNTPREGPSACI